MNIELFLFANVATPKNQYTYLLCCNIFQIFDLRIMSYFIALSMIFKMNFYF